MRGESNSWRQELLHAGVSRHSQASFNLKLRGDLLLLDRDDGVMWKPPNEGTVL